MRTIKNGQEIKVGDRVYRVINDELFEKVDGPRPGDRKQDLVGQEKDDTCPHCGACRHCGNKGWIWHTPPYIPSPQPYWQIPDYGTGDFFTTTDTTITLTGSDPNAD